MIAVDVAGKLRLSELRVEQGKAFLPFYARPIKAALAMI
jgi:hypothetical protein